MKYIVTALLFLSIHSNAQEIRGRVSDQNNQTLPGAGVHWSGTYNGTTTDEHGMFALQRTANTSILVASFVGYVSDSIDVDRAGAEIAFRLKSNVELAPVEITGKKDATAISTIQPRNTEKITEKELLKAACCNLSESFETNPTVDVNYADAVTGAKEIQMLGLSGNYTQLLAEAIPTMTGLGTMFGLNYIPGPWMESIQISKGAASVINGYNAITGQINIEFKKPEEMNERMFINVFGDQEGRIEVNTINKVPLSEKLNYMLLVHGSMNNSRIDDNKDGFLDMPLTRQINIYNRLRYHSGSKFEGQAGVKVIAEDRLGGQKDFTLSDRGTLNSYGAVINTRRVEAYTKTGIVYPDQPYKSMGLQLQGVYHEHNSDFGLRNYDARQQSFYANYGFMSQFSAMHKYRLGADLKAGRITEKTQSTEYITDELMPGMYAEYTFDEGKWGAIAGVRADHHNRFGWFVSPRAHIKYNFTPMIIARISGGRGFRTPLVYADNIGVMVSSKPLLVLSAPRAEEAWNGGANVTARFKIDEREGSISADYYYTFFLNQFIIDQYSSNAVLYYNLTGTSTASSIQATLTYELLTGLDVKLAAKLDEVTTDYLFTPSAARPLFPRQKALVNVAYETRRKRWRADATANWQGTKPLPSTVASPDDDARKYSPAFTLINAQVTRVYKTWEVYLGAENISDFTQKNPIINASSPFSGSFDASSVWGPVTGRKIYAGIRLKII